MARNIKITRPAPSSTVEALGYFKLCYSVEVSCIGHGYYVDMPSGGVGDFVERDQALEFIRTELIRAGYTVASDLPLE